LLAPRPADQYGGQAFRHVKRERQCGKRLAAGAQDIGRADTAGADLANIAAPGEPGQHQPERDRAEQIADRRGGEDRATHRIAPFISCHPGESRDLWSGTRWRWVVGTPSPSRNALPVDGWIPAFAG